MWSMGIFCFFMMVKPAWSMGHNQWWWIDFQNHWVISNRTFNEGHNLQKPIISREGTPRLVVCLGGANAMALTRSWSFMILVHGKECFDSSGKIDPLTIHNISSGSSLDESTIHKNSTISLMWKFSWISFQNSMFSILFLSTNNNLRNFQGRIHQKAGYCSPGHSDHWPSYGPGSSAYFSGCALDVKVGTLETSIVDCCIIVHRISSYFISFSSSFVCPLFTRFISIEVSTFIALYRIIPSIKPLHTLFFPIIYQPWYILCGCRISSNIRI